MRSNFLTIFFTLQTFFISGCLLASQLPKITDAKEQREIVEALSGVSKAEVFDFLEFIPHRYSDSAEIYAASEFLKSRYVSMGIAAEVLEYDPMESFPYFFENTDLTYRTYLRRMSSVFQRDFDGLCDGSLSAERNGAVLQRLKRVDLSKQKMCETDSPKRVELYISSTVLHTTGITKRMLEKRSLVTWPNLVAVIPTSESIGEFSKRPVCVVGAHMDSVARESGGRGSVVSPGVMAPGADDNASGTAAVLTLAKAFKSWVMTNPTSHLPCDLVFAHFSGEEEGLMGSLAFVHLQMKRPILWMINFDMIGYNPQNSEARNKEKFNIGFHEKLSKDLASFFTSRDEIDVVQVEKNTFLYSSDQISFWNSGIPALAVSEQACEDEKCTEPFKYFNPYLHTTEDRSENLDFDYAAKVINHSFQSIQDILLNYKVGSK